MTRQVCVRVGALVLVGLAFLALCFILIRLSQQLAVYRQQEAADQRLLRGLQETLRRARLRQSPTVAQSQPSARDLQAAISQRDATIRQLNLALSSANATINRLQGQLASSRDEMQKALASASERSSLATQNWQTRLTALQQQLDSLKADAQTFRLRITALEADNTKLRSDHSAGAGHEAEIESLITRLQGINQRRDSYLASIIRRYRDVTSQFNAMSGMLGSGQGQASNAFSGAALLRIQNALATTDDDLRHVSDLNAQARQIEMKLLKK